MTPKHHSAERVRSVAIGLTIAVLAFVLLGVGVVAAVRAVRRQLVDSPVSSPQAPARTASASWVALTLIDGNTFFGRDIVVADGRFVALDDAFMIAMPGSEGVASSLRRFGSEIYRPMPQMIVPVGSLLYKQSLEATSSAVQAIAAYEGSNQPTLTSPPSLPSGGLCAVFLKTGDVFFGGVSLDREFVVVTRAHFLQYKDEGAATSGQIESLDQVVLVPQSRTSIGPSGSMSIPLNSVLYVQPLAPDSPVVGALK